MSSLIIDALLCLLDRKLEKVGPKPTSIPYLAARDRGAAAVGDQCAQLYRKCPRDALWPTE